VFVDPDLLQYDEVWAAAGTIRAGSAAASAAMALSGQPSHHEPHAEQASPLHLE